MYNQDYFDEHTKLVPPDQDEFRSMGYAGKNTAYIRYQIIFDYLRNILSYNKIESITDIGAGTGSMWEFISKTDFKQLFSEVKSISLIEPYDKYFTILKKRESRFKELGLPLAVTNFELDYIHSIGHRSDINIMVGALSYYKMDELVVILQQLLEVTCKYLIFEVNVQSPVTPIGNNVYNPSIDFIYQLLYDKGNLQVKFVRKYTSIWLLEKQ